MTWSRIAARRATEVWKGDVAVVGATLSGVAAALAAAQAGRRVCLLEAGPTLATDLSAAWMQFLPAGPLVDRIRAATVAQGAPAERPLDLVLGTLAVDRIVLEAGVTALVKVQATRLLRDRRGRLAGVEVVGKSGRQVARAACVIDATPAQSLARREAGLPERPLLRLARRAYVAGIELPGYGAAWDVPAHLEIEGNRVDATPAAWPGEAILHVLLAPRERSETALLRASLHAITRGVAWLRQQVPALAGLTLVDVAPALCKEFAETDGALETALRGTGVHVLPGRPDLAGAEAVGREAQAGSRALPRRAPLAGSLVHTRELAAAPEQDLASVRLPPAAVRVHDPCDVLVAGYGEGGCNAAIAAAAAGVSVVVLDAISVAGGIGSAGRVHSYYLGLPGGTQDRLDEAIRETGSALAPRICGYHPIGRAEVVTQALAGPHLEVCSGHTAFGVVRTGAQVTGVLSAAADGYHLFPCRVVVDATGEGDVAAAAGAPMTLGREGDGFPQPYSYTPSLLCEGELRHDNFDAGWVDPTDTLEYSRAHFAGRAQLACRGPYTAAWHYCTLASMIGVRESRFAKGPLTLTFDDFLEGRSFADTVCSGYAHHDNHAMDYAEESEWSRRHVVMFGLWHFLCHGDIPYRALLPAEVEGLLLGCRALSVDHDLHQLLRMQRDIHVIGEVCGVAAAAAVQQGVTPRALPLDVLRPLLSARGIQPRAPQKVLDLPVEELLARLSEPGEARGLAMWRLSLLGSQVDWDGFLARTSDPETRAAAAIAAALGKAAGPLALEVLWEAARQDQAGPALGIKSPARRVVAALVLAELRAPGVADVIASMLTPSQSPPDLLLLLRALAQTADARAIDMIRKFLIDNEKETFPIALWGADPGHPVSFRDLIVIRAVRSLAALGSTEECWRLNALCEHPQLLVRRHARRVLAEAARQG